MSDLESNQVSQYIDQFPTTTQEVLNQIRQTIQKAIPDASETISYKIPAYKHKGKDLIYFAGYENHIGLYATPTGHKEFAVELSKYKQGKGSVQFPLDQPIPFELIARIAKFRLDGVQDSDKKPNAKIKKPKIFTMSFASVYPLYISKVQKKGRTKAEVDEAIMWLTGYDMEILQKQIDDKVDFKTFFAKAPMLNPNVSKITGSICGYKIAEIPDPLMKKIRFMDKLVDEIAQGLPMEKILRK